MPQNVLDFKVIVSDDGTLKLAANNINKTGAAVNRLGNAHKKAGDAAHNHFDRLNKGTAGVANGTKNFSKMASSIGDSNGLVGAYATLAANIFAVTAAFGALSRAAQVQQVIEGLDALGTRIGTNLDVASRGLQKLSGGALSLEQSFRSTAQVASAGFGTKTMKELGQVAKDTSFALGRNMTDSLDRLTRGVVKLEPELLDELGLMTKIGESSADYARQLGKPISQLTNFEKRQGFANAIIAEGTAKFGGISDAAGNTKNLDVMGAAFQDLTQSILTFINTAALPLAAIMSNKGLMLGGMILFASTISSQLLPGLTNLSRGAKAAANQALEQATATRTKMEGELKRIQTLNQSRISAAVENLKPIKGVKAYSVKAIGEDRLQPNDALNILMQREKLEEKRLARMAQTTVAEKAAYAEKQKLLRAIDQEIVSVNALIATEERMQATHDRGTKARIANINTVKALRYESLAQSRAANSIEAAGQVASIGGHKKVIESWNQGRKAVHNYALSQAAATAGSGLMVQGFAKIRIASFAASLGVRALGSAFLSLIPIIGWLTIIGTLLYDFGGWVINAFRTKEAKAFSEAMEHQAEVASKLGDNLKELTRLKTANISAAAAEIASTKLVSNSILDNIEAYNAASAAAKADMDKKRSSISGKFALPEFNLKWEDSPQKKFIEDMKQFPDALDRINSEVEKQGLDPKKLRDGVRLTRDEIVKLDTALNSVASGGLAKLGFAVTDLHDNFVELDKAIDDFNLAAVQNTPYDHMVKGLNGVTEAISRVSVYASGSKTYVAQLAAAFSDIGPSAEKFLSVDTQKAIDSYRTVTEKIRQGDKSVALVEQKRDLELILVSRTAELTTVKNMVTEAQRLTRLTASQIAMEQIRLTKLNSFTALSGSTTKMRYAAENGILELEAKQLLIQKDILDTQLARDKLQLAELESLIQINAIYKQIEGSAQSVTVSTAEDVKNKSIANLARVSEAINSSTGADKERWQKVAKGYEITIAQVQNYLNLVQSITDAQNASDTLGAQADAKRASQTSASVSSAAAAATNASTAAANAEALNAITEDQIKLETTLYQNRIKSRGFEESTGEKYLKLIEQQERATKKKRDALIATSASTVAGLQAEAAKAAESNGAELPLIQRKIGLEEQALSVKLKQLDADNESARLALVSINVYDEGIKKQQETLGIYTKMLDAKNELIDKTREISTLENSISRRRFGISDTEDNNRRLEIKAASDNFQQVVRSTKIKTDLIKLEFALLEAKRIQDLADIKAKKAVIDDKGGIGSSQSMAYGALIDQLSQLGPAIQAGMGDAIEVAKLAGVEAARALELLVVSKRDRGGISGAQRNADYAAVSAERAKAREVIAQTEPLTRGDYGKTFIPSMENLSKDLNITLNKLPGAFAEAIKAPLDEIIVTGQPRSNIVSSSAPAANDNNKVEDRITQFQNLTTGAGSMTEVFAEMADKIGPEGRITSSILEGVNSIGDGVINLQDKLAAYAADPSSTNFASSFAAAATIAQSALSTIQSALQASSDAKISAIDKEIAAEQKRDGKTAESVAKIDAFERKKDGIARKAFNMNKKIMMAQAVISVATGITGALALPLGTGIPLAVAIGALGAAQLAIIASTSYQSTASTGSASINVPSLTIGKRSDTVDLAKSNNNVGGELGYLRGSQGIGSNSSNFSTIGSAYGGDLFRGYGHNAFAVGEKGPEIITRDTPITVTPMNDNNAPASVHATFEIRAIDATGVEELLHSQRGNIISMVREAANADGQRFLEGVNVSTIPTKKYGKI